MILPWARRLAAASAIRPWDGLPGGLSARPGGMVSVMAREADRTVISNRRARHDFEIIETYECGLMLVGCEVKSLREGKANLQEAYARVDDGEMWLHGMHVLPYPMARDNPDPIRKRKLLLHRREIEELTRQTTEAGLTLVPLKLYFRDGIAKVELGLAKGKKRWDKRQAIATRDAQRETDRALKSARRSSQG